MPVLLLNASYEPLRLVNWQRAICMVIDGEADLLEGDDEDPVRSQTLTFPKPKVIRLRAFVKIPYRARLPLNRRAVLARDNHTCAYCGGTATTIDHVHPRSRGGPHRWTNVVAACQRCNHRKSDATLDEIGWPLPFKPYAPTGVRWLILGVAEPDPVWQPYLDGCVA